MSRATQAPPLTNFSFQCPEVRFTLPTPTTGISWLMAAHTTHAIGLAFERHAQRFLNHDLRMALTRVGGSGDGGVDLRGYWWLPKPKALRRSSSSSSLSSLDRLGGVQRATRPVQPPGLLKDGSPGRRIAPLRVLAQCKAEKKAQGARVVREMEGVLTHMSELAKLIELTSSERPADVGSHSQQDGLQRPGNGACSAVHEAPAVDVPRGRGTRGYAGGRGG